MPARYNARGGALFANQKMILAVLLVIAIFLIVFVSYRKFAVEKFESAEKKVNIVLVHASWCPHCTDYIQSGTFKVAGDKISAMPEFAGKVQFSDVEYEANKDRVDKYQVTGFPSIIATNSKDEKIMDFSTFRKDPKPDRYAIEDITDFVEAALKA